MFYMTPKGALSLNIILLSVFKFSVGFHEKNFAAREHHDRLRKKLSIKSSQLCRINPIAKGLKVKFSIKCI